MHRMNYILLTSLVLGFFASQPYIARGAEWGNLKAQFIYDGAPPAPVRAKVDKDVAVCGKFMVTDDAVVINQENGGVANIVSFIYVSFGGEKPPVHPSYAETANKEVKVDNNKCRFEPHITILRTSQTLLVGNSDTVGHNTNIAAIEDGNQAQNILVPAGGQLKLNFPAEERFPMHVACNIHPWMHGKIVVKEHPYVAVTDKDGKLEFKNLPAGKWTFQFWHERPGYVKEVSLGGKATSWRRGRVEVDIKPGDNDLGVIKLAPSVFVEKN